VRALERTAWPTLGERLSGGTGFRVPFEGGRHVVRYGRSSKPAFSLSRNCWSTTWCQPYTDGCRRRHASRSADCVARIWNVSRSGVTLRWTAQTARQTGSLPTSWPACEGEHGVTQTRTSRKATPSGPGRYGIGWMANHCSPRRRLRTGSFGIHPARIRGTGPQPVGHRFYLE